VIGRLKILWLKHGQKTIATALGTLAIVDLTPYADDFHALIPWPGWHPLIRLTGAVAIIWRAAQATQTTAVIASQATSNALSAAGVPPPEATAAMVATGTKPPA